MQKNAEFPKIAIDRTAMFWHTQFMETNETEIRLADAKAALAHQQALGGNARRVANLQALIVCLESFLQRTGR
jgi:hypothetical protein